MNARFAPGVRLQGTYVPPADKSISHRSALFGAMSDGVVKVENYLGAEDTHSTLRAVVALGAGVEDHGGGRVIVSGVGLRGARPAPEGIDVGNAGTLMRLLPGWLAGQPEGAWRLDGDDSIRRRPVDRIAIPLREMRARSACRPSPSPLRRCMASSTRCPWRAPRSSPACCSPACWPTARPR